MRRRQVLRTLGAGTAAIVAHRIASVDSRFCALARRPRSRRLDDAERVFGLTEGLIRRGYGDDDIALILGGSFRRALASSREVV